LVNKTFDKGVQGGKRLTFLSKFRVAKEEKTEPKCGSEGGGSSKG